MLVTLLKFIVVNELQPLNAQSPMVVSHSGKVTFFNELNEDVRFSILKFGISEDVILSSSPAVQIRSATEVTHTFDKDTCQQLSLVMLQAVQTLYAEYWELKNRLAACETVAEVEAITWQETGK